MDDRGLVEVGAEVNGSSNKESHDRSGQRLVG